VQVKSGSYEDEDSELGGNMWSVETFKGYLQDNFEGGESLWKKVEDQIRRISLMCLHCVQDLIENKEGCFEWFGLDYVVDDDFNVWLLECNISPDLSVGTQVLDRLVPRAVSGVFDLLTTKTAQGSSWELGEWRWPPPSSSVPQLSAGRKSRRRRFSDGRSCGRGS